MRVIPPLEITTGRLTSTTAVETYSTYNAATTYGVGDKVLSTDGSTVHESLIVQNKGYPLDNSPLWIKYGATEVSPEYDNSTQYVLVGQKFARYDISIEPVRSDVTIPSLTNTSQRYILQRTADEILMGVPQPQCVVIGITYQKFDILKTYALGDIVADDNKVLWASAVASNVGHLLEPPTPWLLVGASNKQTMFNYTSNSRTTATSPFVVVITPAQRVDAIDLSNLTGVSSVRIVVTSGASTVYDQTVNTVTRNITNYYTWFFTPFSYRKSVTKFDLPPVSSPVVTITFTGSGTVGVGSLILGSQFYVGQTQYNAVRDYTNYSTVTREFDGTIANLVQRSGIPKTSQTIWVDKGNVKGTMELIQSLDATPAAWSGVDDATDDYYEPIHIVGIVKSAPIDIGTPTYATLSLELEAISPY